MVAIGQLHSQMSHLTAAASPSEHVKFFLKSLQNIGVRPWRCFRHLKQMHFNKQNAYKSRGCVLQAQLPRESRMLHQ